MEVRVIGRDTQESAGELAPWQISCSLRALDHSRERGLRSACGVRGPHDIEVAYRTQNARQFWLTWTCGRLSGQHQLMQVVA